MNQIEIKRRLEEVFQLPFKVEKRSDTYFESGPYFDGGFLFRLSVVFSTEVRFTIKFQPEAFGLTALKTMSSSSDEQRIICCSYLGMLETRLCTLSLLLDGKIVSCNSPLNWPNKWREFSLTVTKKLMVPVSDKSHEEIAFPYLVTCMAAVLSLFPTEEVDLPVPAELKVLGDPELEGNGYQTTLNRYERSTVNRALCIYTQGCRCTVCGLSFEEKYGRLGKNYIQVHHVVPVSQLGPDYKINPEKDLVPVCPNCHAMLHKVNPPMSVEELKTIVESRKK